MTRYLLVRLLAFAGALAVLASTASADQPPRAADRSPAAAQLAQCVQSHDRLSVLLLVDQSGSLDVTDPSNLRIGGLGAALLGLKRLSEQLGTQKTVEILVAGFYYRVDMYPSGKPRWRVVDERSIDGLLDEVGRFDDRDRIRKRDTDYAAAMIGTRDLFRARTEELHDMGEPPPCKAVIWFTDGRYQVQPRPPSDAKSRGLPPATDYAPQLRLDREDVKVDDNGSAVDVLRFGKRVLCDPRRTMDELAVDGVVKFTVALSDDSKQTKLTPEEKEFLRAMTTGTGQGSQRCGSALSEQTGQYLDAASGKDLLFVFAGIGGPPTPEAPLDPVCLKDVCPEGRSEFRLVDGIDRFVITADTGGEGVEAVLADPARNELRLRPGEDTKLPPQAGARITQWWIPPQQVVIEGVLPPGDGHWHGTWQLAFVKNSGSPPPSAAHSVQLIADLVPTLVDEPRRQLTRGETTRVRFRLARRDGTRNPLLDTASVTAMVTDANGKTSPPQPSTGPDEDGVYTAQVTAPHATASTADFEVHVDFDEGSDIAPIVGSFPIRVKPPKNYPLVSPDHLALASISGAGKSSGELTITGSTTSAGCIWIARPATRAPKEAGKVKFSDAQDTSSEHCLPVARGETKQLRITFDTAGAAAGSVRSTLPVHLRSTADAAKEELTTVPVAFELYPTDVTTAIWRTVLLMVLGLLVPLLILHVLNLLGALFPPEHRVKILAQDVTYAPGRSFSTAGGAPPATDYGKFEWLSLETGSRKRSLDVDQLKLRAVASGSITDRRFRLFQGPYGVATADDRPIFAGASTPLKQLRGGRAHEVPLGLVGTWLFLVDEIDYADGRAGAQPGVRSVDGRLVLLIAADGEIDQGNELERDARAALATVQWPPPELQDEEPKPPSRLDRLREHLPARSAVDEYEPAGRSWLDSDERVAPVPSDDIGGAPPAAVNDDTDGPSGLRF